MSVFIIALFAPAFADGGNAPAITAPAAQGRGLTLAEDMAVSHALASTKKATTTARARAAAAGDSAGVAKCDELLAKIAAIEDGQAASSAKLDAIVEMIRGLGASVEGIPSADQIRAIIREELAAAQVVRVGCVDDGSLPYDPCPEREDEDKTPVVDVPPPPPAPAPVTNTTGLGWLIGTGGSLEYRGAYKDIVKPFSGGGHVLAGLTWENGSGLGTAIIGRAGLATVDSSMLGVSGVVYHDGGSVDCGMGIGIEHQGYDVLGKGTPAANSAGGALSGYLRFGGAASILVEPYLRVGYFTDDGVGGLDTGVGTRISAAFGSP